MNTLAALLEILCVLCLAWVLIWGVVQVVCLARAGLALWRHMQSDRFSDRRRYLDSENMIPLSVLVPLRDEPGAAAVIRRLLELDYPEYEIIVVCDRGEAALLPLVEELGMLAVPRPIRRQLDTGRVHAVYRSPVFPTLTLLDKAPGTLADALNAGINLSRYPHFITLPPHLRPEPDALLQMVMPFLTDHRVVAVSTNPRLTFFGQRPRPIDLLRAGENLRGILRSWGTGSRRAGVMFAGPGAVGAFQKRAVIAAGGYAACGDGEASEMNLRLHHRLTDAGTDHRVRFVPEPLFHLDPPPTTSRAWRALCARWQRRLLENLRCHRGMAFRPRYGTAGWLIPGTWLMEAASPFLGLAGYILVPLSFALGYVSLPFLVGFFALSVLFGVIPSLGALLLEINVARREAPARQLAGQCLMAFLSNFGYRQMLALLRIYATFSKNSGEPSREDPPDPTAKEAAP